MTREMAMGALNRVEPFARQTLKAYAQRERLGLTDELPVFAALTSSADNGGWGELMPVWFKPYERPVPICILDNWALPALLWRHWLGDVGPAFNTQNLLKIFVGSSVLIPFLPATQRGGHFLRHGALTVLLGLLWLPPAEREAFIPALRAGATRFAETHRLREQADLGEFLGRVEADAFLVAEGSKIGGEEKVRAFLANAELFDAYAALFGGLCFSLAALYDSYGPEWEAWAFQAINVHYRYAGFGLEPWARWLGMEYAAPGEERS